METKTEFKVGQLVIGNKLADERYLVTRTGFLGVITQIHNDNRIRIKEMCSDNSGLGEFDVDSECFNVIEKEGDLKQRSLDCGLLTKEELEEGRYIEYEGLFYSNKDFVLCEDGKISLTSRAFYCVVSESWYSKHNTMFKVYGNLDDDNFEEIYPCSLNGLKKLENDCFCLVNIGNKFFTESYIIYNSDYVVYDYRGDLCYREDVYYWESDGEFHHEPEKDDDYYEYVRDYHSGGFRTVDFGGKTPFKIGFEIEKEDQEVKKSMYVHEFKKKTNGVWRKERDGSLCDESGYELISPTYEFDVEKIFEDIRSNSVLVEHINAGYTTSCGGHIHLSKKGLDGWDLFDSISGYTPLLYALYYGRVGKNYSKGKSNKDLKDDNEKYQAIRIHDDRVEFRIISAVPSVDVLEWRARLIQEFTKRPTSCVKEAYYNVDTKFSDLIREVYDTDEKYLQLKHRIIKYTKEFENIKLSEKPKRKYTKRQKALGEIENSLGFAQLA